MAYARRDGLAVHMAFVKYDSIKLPQKSVKVVFEGRNSQGVSENSKLHQRKEVHQRELINVLSLVKGSEKRH